MGYLDYALLGHIQCMASGLTPEILPLLREQERYSFGFNGPSIHILMSTRVLLCVFWTPHGNDPKDIVLSDVSSGWHGAVRWYFCRSQSALSGSGFLEDS